MQHTKLVAKIVKHAHVVEATMFEADQRSKLSLLISSSFPFQISEIEKPKG